jgi:hypothetical protein
MSEHPEFDEWECNISGKEDFADGSGDGSESVADAADDHVLKRGGEAEERWPLVLTSEETGADELVWQS